MGPQCANGSWLILGRLPSVSGCPSLYYVRAFLRLHKRLKNKAAAALDALWLQQTLADQAKGSFQAEGTNEAEAE